MLMVRFSDRERLSDAKDKGDLSGQEEGTTGTKPGVRLEPCEADASKKQEA